MDARARTVDATSAEFWQVERKLGGAIAANPDAQSEYAKIVTGSPRKGGRR
ncbi:hypothetical protein [Bradyrhizobium diazoefficiens]|uniref:hypothetical protein n=1 Tax=Bradyrhizobium diazoefficiens TaxID=1355477 RepID=UPI00271457E9|nr:hypothetical protein [Bradyrhizobium diazoefficiens]WLA53192.1 hypothetical protein QIH81_21635 [Bradyrhizobium diazoefficiens]